MSNQDDHLYPHAHFGYSYHSNAAPPVPPPHHTVPFQQQEHILYPAAPLQPSSQNHMHLPQASAGIENQDVMHDKIGVEQPMKRTRRRRGEAAAERQAAQAAAGNVSKPVRSKPYPGVVIKTKFPVARIKRIMQADEDVGKVAQVTPVIVSKALELFMIALCEKASQQARSRNSKRITASHLKQAVLADEQFDFLEDIMAKVPEVPLPTENTNQGNGSDEEANNSGPPGSAKKPRKPRTRKPKDEDSY